MRDTIIIFDNAGLNVKSPVSDNDHRMRQHPYQKFNVGVAGDNNVDRIIFKSKAFSKYPDADWFIKTCNRKGLFKDIAYYEDGDITYILPYSEYLDGQTQAQLVAELPNGDIWQSGIADLIIYPTLPVDEVLSPDQAPYIEGLLHRVEVAEAARNELYEKWLNADADLTESDEAAVTVEYLESSVLFHFFLPGQQEIAWDNILDKPEAFPPEYHTHLMQDITGLVDALAGKQDTIQDLSDIRAGAALGATALQAVPENYATKSYADGAVSTHNNSAEAHSNLFNEKVDKVAGKGLSTEDFTTAEKEKLAGIEPGAKDYTLPAATTATLGGVIVGNDLLVTAEGRLSVDKATTVEGDNTRPITAAAVYTEIGNINALLSII